jgi:hypothetical protein
MANYVFYGLFVAVTALVITFLATKLYKREGFTNATEIGQYIAYTSISLLAICVIAYFKMKFPKL